VTYSSWIALVVVVAFGLVTYVFFSRWLRLKRVVDGLHLKDNSEFIVWLELYQSWYSTSSNRCYIVLMVCRITPIFIGFVVAILEALGDDPFKNLSYLNKSILVIMFTGISTVCVAVLTQLRVADLATARENGRISCASLVARAQLFFSRDPEASESYQEKVRIKDELFKIEFDQAALFDASVDGRPKNTPDGGGPPGSGGAPPGSGVASLESGSTPPGRGGAPPPEG
jgi:hypothetical protein